MMRKSFLKPFIIILLQGNVTEKVGKYYCDDIIVCAFNTKDVSEVKDFSKLMKSIEKEIKPKLEEDYPGRYF